MIYEKILYSTLSGLVALSRYLLRAADIGGLRAKTLVATKEISIPRVWGVLGLRIILGCAQKSNECTVVYIVIRLKFCPSMNSFQTLALTNRLYF